MQYIVDFFSMIGDGISQAWHFTGYFIGKIPSIWSAWLNFWVNVPVWITTPVMVGVSVAIIFQIISLIPTESGGNS